jgi:hypothetical protein
MALLIYILVVIGALFVMASGFWVAMTLVKVVSTKQKSEVARKKTPDASRD